MKSSDRILLVGMMGAGKTTVGRALARRLGYRYRDSDHHVEQRTGMTVREIFETEGEPAFRAHEKAALHEALADGGPAVVSVAGGAVLDAENRRLLRRSGLVVWLRASPATLARRVMGADHRPLLGEDPLKALTELYPGRAPLYEEVADLVVDTDERTPEEAVDQILEHVAA